MFKPKTLAELDAAKTKLSTKPDDFITFMKDLGTKSRTFERFTCAGFCGQIIERIHDKRKKFFGCTECAIRISKTKYTDETTHLKAEKRARVMAEWQKKNKKQVQERARAYRKENADYFREYGRAWREKNKSKTNAWAKQYYHKNRANDESFKILRNSRARVFHAVTSKSIPKDAPTIELIGCSIPALKAHLESQFVEGVMSWDNYGPNGWHIDHIRPCASFDLLDPDQQRQCFHYSNLRPLLAIDNLTKGAKWAPTENL